MPNEHRLGHRIKGTCYSHYQQRGLLKTWPSPPLWNHPFIQAMLPCSLFLMRHACLPFLRFVSAFILIPFALTQCHWVFLTIYFYSYFPLYLLLNIRVFLLKELLHPPLCFCCSVCCLLLKLNPFLLLLCC